MRPAMRDFYPRSPRGERLKSRSALSITKHFYPRSPRGERQKAARVFTGIVKFLSTLPARGATPLHGGIKDFKSIFLSTLPARGATVRWRCISANPAISIHAPREGSDWYMAGRRGTPSYFYPRSPRGERRSGYGILCEPYNFYPRSPRGERPSSFFFVEVDCILFLSTLPARGATTDACASRGDANNFYPRSPRGERLMGRVPVWAVHQFLSTLPARGATARERVRTPGQ